MATGLVFNCETGETTAVEVPDPGAPPLADAIDGWKIKYVLAGKPGHTTGVTLLDDVTAAVTGLGDQQALIKFQSFPQWLLTDPLIPMLKGGLGIDDATFESYWREAMAL